MRFPANGSLLVAVALVALLQEPALVEPPLETRIEDLRATRTPDGVVVSFRVAGAFDEELLERLNSGIPVRFKHRVRVMAKRGIPLTPAKEIGRTRVETEAIYDALTGQYELVRETDFRQKGEAPPRREAARTTSSETEMRRFMTEFTDVPVSDPDPAAEAPLTGEKLRVRVESNLGRRFLLLIIPATRDVSAEVALEP